MLQLHIWQGGTIAKHIVWVCSVYVLEGGFPAWEAAEGPVAADAVDDAAVSLASDAAAAAVAAAYPAQLDKRLVTSMAEVTEHLNLKDAQLIDARSSGRFKGVAPEPRPDLPSGAMPGAQSPPSWRSNAHCTPGSCYRFRLVLLLLAGHRPSQCKRKNSAASASCVTLLISLQHCTVFCELLQQLNAVSCVILIKQRACWAHDGVCWVVQEH